MLSGFVITNAKVTVQRPTITQDAAGGTVRTFRAIGYKVPAFIPTLNASEPTTYGGPRSTRSGYLLFDTWRAIRPDDRILWGSRTLEVRGVYPVSHNEDGTACHIRVEWDEINDVGLLDNPNTDYIEEPPV